MDAPCIVLGLFGALSLALAAYALTGWWRALERWLAAVEREQRLLDGLSDVARGHRTALQVMARETEPVAERAI
jgi:hypothetical protein